MKAPANTSRPRVLCPPGEQLCRVIQIVDLGTQHFKPGDEGSRKLYFGFETAKARHVFDEKKGPEPYMLQAEFAWFMKSSGKKTKLRQFVESFWGKAFPSDDAAQDFDFSTMLAKTCFLVVSHQFKTDGTPKAVVMGVRPAKDEEGKPIPVPERVNPLICYEVANGEDDNFKLLPPFLQKKVRESDEFNGSSHPEPEANEPDEPSDPSETAGDPEEGIPF